MNWICILDPQSVKRNSKRFPESFCFQLTEEEYIELRSQFATSKTEIEPTSTKGGRRYLPYVFTEAGITMLSAVLRSDEAIHVSVNIMNTFVKMRRFLAENALMFDKIQSLELKQLEYQKESNEKFNQIFAYISEHEEVEQKIFFDGQIYDAFSLLVSLVEFLIIDETTAYHIGASVKDAGKKCFGITRIEDVKIISDILQRLEIEAEDENN